MSEFPERAISGGPAFASEQKFTKFLRNHTALGPKSVSKYVRVVRPLLKGGSFDIEEAAKFCKRKNRTYVKAAVIKYIECLEDVGLLKEWGPGSRDWLVKKLPKVHEPPPRPRKMPSAQELMDAVLSLEKEYRQAAMFMFYTGARSEEAMGVQLKDVDFDGGDITIYTKHKTEKAPKLVKLPRDFMDELHQYHRSLGTLNGEYLFLPDSKASLESRTRMFRMAWGKACKKILGRSLGAHDFRRFAGIEIWKSTGDPKAAKDYLGHAKLETTMRYLDHADRNNALEKGRDIMARVVPK